MYVWICLDIEGRKDKDINATCGIPGSERCEEARPGEDEKHVPRERYTKR
jgi:hypothetical protein